MKLYLLPPSPNSRKLIFAVAHLGLDIPVEEIYPSSGRNRTSAYLALNPNGKMPVLAFDDGRALWESNAILNRLADGSALWPKGPAQSEVLQWQFWEASHWGPTQRPFIRAHFFGREGIDLEAATGPFREMAQILDSHLATRQWLVGGGMTTADIAVAAALVYRDACHFPLDGMPHLAAWIARMEAQPAWSVANPPMG